MKKILLLVILLGITTLSYAQSNDAKIIGEGMILQDRVEQLETRQTNIRRTYPYYGGSLATGIILANVSEEELGGQLFGAELALVGLYGCVIQGIRGIIVSNKLLKAQNDLDIFLEEHNAIILPDGSIEIQVEEQDL